MTRDFAKPLNSRKTGTSAKKPAPRSRQKKSAPEPKRNKKIITFAVVITILIGFGYGLYLLNQNSATKAEPSSKAAPETPAKTAKATNAPKPAASTAAKTESTAAKPNQAPRFTFYGELPQREIETPDENPYTPQKGNRPQYDYLLQAGSFRRYEDAHRQMGLIAMQGLKPYISQTSDGNWYRVMVGPFSSRSKMNSATDRLVKLNIQPLQKKIPREK